MATVLSGLFLATGPAEAQLAIGQGAFAGSPMVFDMRKSLPMESTEVAVRDFYINAGPEVGFKRGQFLKVMRSTQIHDPFSNQQQAVMSVPVGFLQVIHVERGITVARLHSETTTAERPVVEFEGVMVGDRIDMSSISAEAPKAPAKRGASEEKPSPSLAPADKVAQNDPLFGTFQVSAFAADRDSQEP
jgi:hypothetical protein